MEKEKILKLGLISTLALSTGIAVDNLYYQNVVYAEDNVTADIKNYKNLADGEYTLNFATKRADNSGNLSMANDAMQKPAKLIVKNGEYKIQLTFTPLTFLGQHGYLGNLEYYSNNVKTQAEIVSYYSETEKDNFFEVYKSEFSERTAYPKTFSIPIDKASITENGILVQKIGVYVPVMASINPESGRQDALTEFDFTTLTVVKLDEPTKPSTSTPDNQDNSQGGNAGNSVEENNNSSNSNPNDNKNDISTGSSNTEVAKNDTSTGSSNTEVTNNGTNTGESNAEITNNVTNTGESNAEVTNKDTNSNNSNIDISDVRNLPDGEYTIGANIYNASVAGKLSMADGALVKPAKLIVKDGNYSVELTFKPLKIGQIEGYLGRLSYYDNYGSVRAATVISTYASGEPKVVRYPIDKNKIDSENILRTRVRVYVPAMASINPDLGNQDALPTFNFNNLQILKGYLEVGTEDGDTGEGEVVTDIVSENPGNTTSNNTGKTTGYTGGQLKKLLSKTGIYSVQIEKYYVSILMLIGALALLKKKKNN